MSVSEMAERGGHAPQAAKYGSISLAKNPGSLVRFTFHWCPWQDLHPHWTRSELVASALGYAENDEWCSRQEFRLQPPRSKRGALYIELREHLENGAPGRFRPVCLLSVSEAIYY